MYNRILLAFDGSEAGRSALFECADIDHLLHAELHLLAVVPPAATLYTPGGGALDAHREDDDRQFREVLKEGLRLLGERGVRAQEHLATGEPVSEICRVAGELKCDLIAVGHQHRDSWLTHWWKSSVGVSLIDSAPCSVLITISRQGEKQ